MTKSSLVELSKRILHLLGFLLMVVGLVLSTTAGSYVIIMDRLLRHTVGVALTTAQIAMLGVAFIVVGVVLIFKMS